LGSQVRGGATVHADCVEQVADFEKVLLKIVVREIMGIKA
jgi:hypothetical protein